MQTPAAQAATITVGPGQTYTTIQAGINAASPGDTVTVLGGTYYESVVVNKSIALVGNGMPVVDGGRTGIMAIYVAATGVRVQGFTATNTTSGISVFAGDAVITGNSAVGNSGFGIMVGGSPCSNITIFDNIVNNPGSNTGIDIQGSNDNVTGNHVTGSDFGIASFGTGNTISENSVTNGGYGIYLQSSSNNIISSNIVTGNTLNGLFGFNSSNNIITGNRIINNPSTGIFLNIGSSNNLFTLNVVEGNTGGNAGVVDGSPNYWNSTTPVEYTYGGQTYTDYTGNYWGDSTGGDNGQGIHDTSYAIAPNNLDYHPMVLLPVINLMTGLTFDHIQAAINDVNTTTGDTIVVYSGTYPEQVVINKSISLVGNGMPVIDGSGGIVAVTITSSNAAIRGFNVTDSTSSGIMITSSDNDISNNDINGNSYFGIYLLGSRNNLIRSNTVRNARFGISIESASINNTISGNIAHDNTADGINDCSMDTIITGNDLYDNSYGIYFYTANGSLATGNSIHGNTMHGIWALSSDLNITGNSITNDNDGILLDSGTANITVAGNTITDNTNGIAFVDSIRNNISRNIIRDNNYGIALHYSEGSEANNTFWLNHMGNNFSDVYFIHVVLGQVDPSNNWNSTVPVQYGIGGASFTGYAGNYWPYDILSDANDDGVIDSVYELDAHMLNVDYYPMDVPGIVYPDFEHSTPSTSDPLTIQFEDRSAGYRQSWAWDFGDGSPGDTVKDPLHTFTAPGIYHVRMTAVNNSIGYDSYKDVAVPQDWSPLSTQCNLYGSTDPNGWYTGDVSVELSVTGASGTSTTHYSFDNETWNDYSGQLYVTDDGVTPIYYYSTDSDGSVEPVKLAYVKIEKTGLASVAQSTGTITGYGSLDIYYTLNDARAHQVYLCVYDQGDDLVRTMDLGYQDSGSYTATWNGTDDGGNEVSDGNYTLRLSVALDNSTSMPANLLTAQYLFNSIRSISVDSAGNMFVADPNNNAVKEICANGSIMNFGSWNRPGGAVVDTAGDVYVFDNYVWESGGTIIKVATDGTRTPYPIDWQQGWTVDPDGNIYYSYYDASIYEVYPNGTTVVRATGTPFATWLAADVMGNIYVNQYYTGAIVKVAPDDTKTTLVPDTATSNRVMAVDPSGDLYFYDANAGTLTEYLADGTQVEILGSPFSYGTISAMWANAPDCVYASTSDNRIYRIDRDGTVTVMFDRTGMGSGAAFDTAGNLYVANALSSGVDELHTDGTITHPGIGISQAGGVAIDRDNNVYVADTASGDVKKIDGASGDTSTVGTGFNAPMGVAVDRDGSVFVANSGDHSINKIDTGGVITQVGGYFDRPTGVAVDPLGDVFVADPGQGRVSEIYPNGTTVDLPNSLSNPWGITLDNAGNIYVSQGDTVEKIRPDGSLDTETLGANGGITGIAADQSGGIAIASAYGARKYASTGALNSDLAVAVDNHGPEIWASYTGDTDTNGNYIDEASVTMTASDAGSSVGAIYYNIDQGYGGPWTEYTGTPVTITGTGYHDFYYYAVDNSGNIGSTGDDFVPIVSSQGALHASFTTDIVSGEAPLDVSFTETSTGSIESRQWDFGDGTGIDSSIDPVHEFDDPGTYTVVYTIYDNNGHSSSNGTTIYVSPAGSSAGFTSAPGSDPLSIQFTDTSKGSVESYGWDFGDNTDGTSVSSPYHIFISPGTYHVTLITYYAQGSSLYRADVTVSSQSLSASFSTNVTSGISPLTVSFTDTSTGDFITNKAWDFGDGDTASGSYVEHTYTTPGKYNATLTVWDASDSSTANRMITVLANSGHVTNTRTGLVYTKINDAITDVNTTDGDTILIDNGTYYENVVVNKRLTLQGNPIDGTDPVVDVSIYPYSDAIDVSADGATIDGLDTTGFFAAGIRVTGNNCTIRNSDAHDGSWEDGRGVMLVGANNTTISDYRAENEYEGIGMDASQGITIQNVSAQNLRNYGIDGQFINHTYIDNIFIRNCGGGVGEFTGGEGNVSCINNVTIINASGLSIDNFNDVSVTGLHTQNTSTDIYLYGDNNVTIRDYTSDGSMFGIEGPDDSNMSVYDSTIRSNAEEGISIYGGRDWYIHNVTIDGAGWNGIDTQYADHILIDGARVNNTTWDGFLSFNLNNSTITGLQTTNTTHNGIKLISSDNVTVRDCQALQSGSLGQTNTACFNLTSSSNITIKDSIAGESPYAPAVYLQYTHDSTISNVTSNGATSGIAMDFSDNNNVTGNTVNYNGGGIVLGSSKNNTVTGNTANNNTMGIMLYFDDANTTVTDNTANDNEFYGFYSIQSSYNDVSDNTFNNNREDGMYVTSTDHTNVTCNLISNNTIHGITMNWSSNNVYWLNKINNNTVSVNVNGGGNNLWNSTAALNYTDPNGVSHSNYTGNYWGDYAGPDTNFDGIGDNPYNIDGDNIDLYPMLLTGSAAHVNPIIVDPVPGVGMFTDIPDALDYALPGDTIIVHSGSYSKITVDTSVNITGVDTGAGLPIISTSGDTYSVTITADNVTFDGFNLSSNTSSGIDIRSNNTTISNDLIIGHAVPVFGTRYGIFVESTSSNNTLFNNNVSYNNAGIYLDSSSNNNLTNNIVANNTNPNPSPGAGSNTGIYLRDSISNNLAGNTANNNTQDGIVVSDSDNNSIMANTADGNGNIGIQIDSSDNNSLAGNMVVNNSFYGLFIDISNNNNMTGNQVENNTNYGIFMSYSMNNILWLNTFSGNGINAYARGDGPGTDDNAWNSTSQLTYTDYNGVSHENYTGNYWGDYHGQDANTDGIGDSLYTIDLYNVDLYPMLLEAPSEHVPLVADFMTSATSGDSPLTVQFNDTSTGTNLPDAWAWVINNTDLGSTAYTGNDQNFSFTFLAPGNYSISLAAHNSTTGESSTSGAQNIAVTSNFAADFTLSPASGSSPLTVQFNDTSTGNNAPDAWSWTIYDGNSSIIEVNSSQNISYTFTAPDNYTVTLTASNSSTTEHDAFTSSVNVSTPMIFIAAFDAVPEAGILPLTVQFNDESIGDVASYDWNFGDGPANDTGKSPSHTYTTAGTYTAVLTVMNSTGATSSTSRQIDVLSKPPYAYIPNTGDNTVSVIDITNNTVIATFPAGASSQGVAVSPDGKTAYITNNYNGDVSVIDTATNTVTAAITVGPQPFGIALSPDGTKAYVANAGDGSVSVIDTAMNTVTATIPTSGQYIQGVAVSPNGKKLYITSLFKKYVTVIDTATNTVTGTIEVGSYQVGVAFTPDGTKAYVATNGNITVIDAVNDKKIDSINNVNYPVWIAMSPDGTKAYVTGDKVYAIDTINDTIAATVPVGDNSQGVAVSPDGAMVYVVDSGNYLDYQGHVYVIDAGDYTVVTEITVGNSSYAWGPFISAPALPALAITESTDTVTRGIPSSVSFHVTDSGLPVDGATVTLTGNATGSGVTDSSGNVIIVVNATAPGRIMSTARLSGHAITTISMAANESISAGFTANVTSGQAPLDVLFNGSTTGYPEADTWNYTITNSTGTFYVNGQNFTYTFLYPDSYDISLNASNTSIGVYSISPSRNIVVSEGMAAGFSINRTSGPAPLTVQFNDTSYGSPEADSWNYTVTNSTTTFYVTGQDNFTYTFLYPDTYTVSLNASNSSFGTYSTSGTQSLTVSPPGAPVADFTMNTPAGEAPLTVTFTDSSSGSPTSWDWDFGDGNTDSGSTVTHTYAVPGSYNATLTIHDAYVQSSTVGHVVDVWAPLQAHIAGNVTGGVAPLCISFNDTSDGYPGAWSWTINNSSVPLVYSDASQNFTYTFEYPDTYNVTLLVSNGTRTSTVIVQVVVTAASLPPVANFISNVTVGVSPLTVEFNDTSGGIVTGRDWNFDDGMGNDTAQNVTRTFTNNGPYNQTFTVTLTVSGPDGSSTRQMVDYIAVIPQTPVANFTADATSGDAPLTVQFNDTSVSAASSWLWDFGDGSTSSIRNATHTYLSSGSYDVSLNISNDGGYDNKTVAGYITITAPVTISADFTASPTTGTAPLTVLFNDTTAGYPEADGWNYTITNSTATVYNTSRNFTYTFLYPDTYTVILNASNSSTGQFSISGARNIVVTSPAGPVADYTYSPHSGESPLTVTFTDASSGSPVSWDWDFGDGNTSSGPIVTHTYATVGSYITTLTVHDAYSQSDSAGHNVDVWMPLAAYFTSNVSAGTAPMDVLFNDTSAGYPASWLWSINNSSDPLIYSGTSQNFTFTFAYPDTYNVTLQVTNGTRTSTIVSQIIVSAAAVPPAADFTSNVTAGVSPLDVQFNDTSGGIVTGYDWNFGDAGSNDSARNATRTFYNTGPSNRTFTITLTVSGPDGSSTRQVSDYITVVPQPPVANFTSNVTGGFTPLTVQFNDTSSGAIGFWLWDFGDGNSSTLQNDTHIYTASGLYPVTLTVSNAGGSDVMSKTGYISVSSPSLAAGFTVNQTIIPVGASVSFTDTTTGSLIADRWNYTISNSTSIEYVDVPGQADFTYEFDNPDTYQVSLNASNSSNDINSISATQSIYVYTPFAASFTMNRSSGEAPLSVLFNDTSSGYPDADSWNYTIANSTDTFHVTGRNFTYTFIYPDTYTVSLNASNSSIGGFSISGIQSVVVTMPAAQAVDFSATPSSGEAPLAVTFAGTSTGVPVSWAWDFGDGNYGIGQTAYHTYNAAGAYTVVLTVTDAYSQTGTASHTVDVWPGLVADFSSNVTGGVAPLDVQFNDTSAGYPDSWQWTIYDPASNPIYSDNSRNISYRFENGGTYTIMLQAGNGTRTNSISKLFTVDSPTALTASFNANRTGGAVPLDVQFNDTSAGYPDSWAWTITDSGSNTVYSGSSRNFTYSFMSPDTYTVSLTVTNGSRTNTVSSQIVATIPILLVARITANQTSGTGPLTVQFDDTSSGDVISREWNLSDTAGNITAQNFIHTFDTQGTYTVVLTVYNATASSTDSVQIQVLPPDIIPLQAGIDVNATAGSIPLTIQFNDSSIGYPDTFAWNFGDGSANSSARNVTYTYTSAGTFTAMLTVVNGSQTSTASVNIFASVPVVPMADFRANLTKGIAPAAVQFYDLSTGSPESWSWDFGDGNTSGDENPVHTYVTPGLYSVSLTAENMNGSNTSVRTGYINISKSLLENGEYHAALTPGWNLVSFPIDNYPLEASALTGTGVQDVAIFNTTTGRYDIYMMNQSGPENDIPISPGVGYFVYCDQPTDLGIQGEDPSGNSITLNLGWNLVGWERQDTSDAQTLCAQLSGSQQIVRYNSGDGFFEGYVEDVSPDSYDFAIQPGAGYFIYTDTPQTLNFGGL